MATPGLTQSNDESGLREIAATAYRTMPHGSTLLDLPAEIRFMIWGYLTGSRMIHLKLKHPPITPKEERDDKRMFQGGLLSTFCEAPVSETAALVMFHDSQYQGTGNPPVDLRHCSERHQGCYAALVADGQRGVDVRWFRTCSQMYNEAASDFTLSFADQYTLKAFMGASSTRQRRRAKRIHLHVSLELWNRQPWNNALTSTRVRKLLGTKSVSIAVEMTKAPSIDWFNSAWRQRLMENFVKLGALNLRDVEFSMNQKLRPGETDHLTWPQRRVESLTVSQNIQDPTAWNLAIELVRQANAAAELANFATYWRSRRMIIRANDDKSKANDLRAHASNLPVPGYLYVVLTLAGRKDKPLGGYNTSSRRTNPVVSAPPLATDATAVSHSPNLATPFPPRSRPRPDIRQEEEQTDTNSASDLSLAPRFHYGFFIQYDARGGLTYTINGSSGVWVPDHGATRNIQLEPDLIGLFQIADYSSVDISALGAWIGLDDVNLNASPSMTSEAWMMECLVRLRGYGLLTCHDFGGLNAELVNFGVRHASRVVAGAPRTQCRRPIESSAIADLTNGDDPMARKRLRASLW